MNPLLFLYMVTIICIALCSFISYRTGYKAGKIDREKELANSWEKSWDCSADPGHKIMNKEFKD